MNVNVDVKYDLKDQKVMNAAKKTLAEIMYMMEAEAKRKCPVDTGRLRASIHVDKISDSKYLMADGVTYGKFQEFGTIKMRAQPFFRPAINLGKKKVPIILEKNLRD